MNNINTDTLSTLFDKENRRKIMDDPREYAQSLGMDVEGKEVVVVVSGKNTVYIPMYEVNAEMSAVELGDIQAAGGSASTAGTASTAGCASTGGSCIGTLSSVSTAGSAGSVVAD